MIHYPNVFHTLLNENTTWQIENAWIKLQSHEVTVFENKTK